MSTPDTNFNNAGTPAPAGLPAAAVPPVSGAAHRSMLRTLIVLIRRELWEHRALWAAPVAIAVLLMLLMIPIRLGLLEVEVGEHPELLADPANNRGLFTVLIWGQSLPQYLVMVIVLSFYLLDCLYIERKDRSILFWKSLPVSDAATVISKVLVAVVVVPLGVYLIALVTSIVAWGLWAVRISFGPPILHAAAWDTLAWLKVQGLMLYGLVVSMAWYTPLAGFLLLVSAWARRNVFLWATLPPLAAILAEKAVLRTRYVEDLLAYRTWGVWEALGIRVDSPESHGRVVSLADLFDNVSMSRALANIDLWLGLAVAAAFIFAAIRIRRYRDDT